MRSATVSIKVTKWVTEVFNVASKQHNKAIRRWSMKDHNTEYYCNLKYNEYGRYISFIAKIFRFINVPDKEKKTQLEVIPRLESSFKEAIRTSRWQSEGTKASPIKTNKSKISIPGGTELTEKDVLNRCIVGKVMISTKESPTLNDIRRWAGNNWKSAISINVYEMNDFQFLFEFPSRKEAEHPYHWMLAGRGKAGLGVD
ncbi:hypothetical protein A4A49_61177 [Nicotiana attenuata]|uniref:DUF4283 domain-containing protein n=1 Tax=Nicotiana attenuata TaxID=49451 RepID=A0A314LB16_NICAT|nr:hypothetical protein A4A49_61177 [Nicotiana attenuata]